MSTIRFLLLAAGILISAWSAQASTVLLRWSAPGDDGRSGRASYYDLRYSVTPLTESNWNLATPVSGLPAPLPYGNKQSAYITGLLPSTTYYIGIRAADERLNWSPLSNIARRTTCAGCVGNTGNINGSLNGVVDLVDLSYFVAYLTAGTAGAQFCFEEANVDGSADGVISLTDLSYLVAFLTGSRSLPLCR